MSLAGQPGGERLVEIYRRVHELQAQAAAGNVTENDVRETLRLAKDTIGIVEEHL